MTISTITRTCGWIRCGPGGWPERNWRGRRRAVPGQVVESGGPSAREGAPGRCAVEPRLPAASLVPPLPAATQTAGSRRRLRPAFFWKAKSLAGGVAKHCQRRAFRRHNGRWAAHFSPTSRRRLPAICAGEGDLHILHFHAFLILWRPNGPGKALAKAPVLFDANKAGERKINGPLQMKIFLDRIYEWLGRRIFPGQQDWEQRRNVKIMLLTVGFALALGLTVAKVIRLIYNHQK